jgi:hypothetical protein
MASAAAGQRGPAQQQASLYAGGASDRLVSGALRGQAVVGNKGVLSTAAAAPGGLISGPLMRPQSRLPPVPRPVSTKRCATCS